MEVIIAQNVGFCMGVNRAWKLALGARDREAGEVYTYGDLIHNPQALEFLRNRGITILERGQRVSSGVVVIRAHGIPPYERQELESDGHRIIDGTCHRVALVQGIISESADSAHATIIVGDKNHPEVVGLLGYTRGKGYVVSSPDDVLRIPCHDLLIVVAQTTQSEIVYDKRVAEIKERFPNVIIHNTICDATAKRQYETIELSKDVDAIIVIGGRKSANTQRLAETSQSAGVYAYHVETDNELDTKEIARYKKIGIVSGTSTPDWLINNVIEFLAQL